MLDKILPSHPLSVWITQRIHLPPAAETAAQATETATTGHGHGHMLVASSQLLPKGREPQKKIHRIALRDRSMSLEK